MKKEDIIRLAKNDNNQQYELESTLRGSTWALLAILFIGIGLNVVAYLTEKSADMGICAMMFTGLACETLIEGRKTQSKKLTFIGVFFAIMAAIFIIGYIVKKVGLS